MLSFFFSFFSLHNPFVFAWSLVGVVDCECRIHTISGSDLSGWNCGDQCDRRPRSETNWCHWSCELLCFFSACCLSHASLSIYLSLSLSVSPSLPPSLFSPLCPPPPFSLCRCFRVPLAFSSSEVTLCGSHDVIFQGLSCDFPDITVVVDWA